MQQWMKNKKVRIWVPPFIGFLFYGSWALLANSCWLHVIPLINIVSHTEGSREAALTAGLTQGAYSFTVTLLLSLIIEWLFQRLTSWPLRSLWVFFIALTLLISTSAGVNIIVGTPNVLLTILPGLIVSTFYTGGYILALRRIHP